MTLDSNDLAEHTYLVGGAVRDGLLNRPIHERDYLVVGLTREAMLAHGFKQVGKDFPVFLHPKTKEEYALARTERKQGKGYTGFSCYAEPDVTIEQDLLRRDLTINAMAQDQHGHIIDPYNGQADLEKRLLRHVSTAFSEDPLRVLRVARFAARYHYLGFTVAPETIELMQQMADNGELAHLTPDRIWKEVSSALSEQHPQVFVQVLRQCGALRVIWPSLDALWGVPNPAHHHPEVDSGVHTLMVLEQAVKLSDSIAVRFACLCHDLGKGLTDKSQWPRHYGHEKSGIKLVKQVCKAFKVPNEVRDLSIKACEFHLHAHRAFELKPSTVLTLFDQLDAWRKPQQFEHYLLVCEADAKGRIGFEHSDYRQADYLRDAYQQCLTVKAKPFVERGLQGKEIKDAIYQQRLKLISTLKDALELIQ
ncbi:multifunctional CCA addition/repair protein [Thalassotalea ponticola]|uniref:multifunctional CCA addition/repair protein n=1 Tax=Thalassotalea ponticola TaxID=1523392 RepID=UPI0025B5493E|nr:multifunctional CCA addition/repair protein [Thalassotalea ponticola]MDN3651963.1 multifunctional CCA addition/repair protein [Thalassotalea ponticola]